MPDPNLSGFIWSVADLLRGDFRQSEYGRVILPFTVLRRLDCALEPTKEAVLAELARCKKQKLDPDAFLLRAFGQHFYNTSPLDMKKLMTDEPDTLPGDPDPWLTRPRDRPTPCSPFCPSSNEPAPVSGVRGTRRGTPGRTRRRRRG